MHLKQQLNASFTVQDEYDNKDHDEKPKPLMLCEQRTLLENYQESRYSLVKIIYPNTINNSRLLHLILFFVFSCHNRKSLFLIFNDFKYLWKLNSDIFSLQTRFLFPKIFKFLILIFKSIMAFDHCWNTSSVFHQSVASTLLIYFGLSDKFNLLAKNL